MNRQLQGMRRLPQRAAALEQFGSWTPCDSAEHLVAIPNCVRFRCGRGVQRSAVRRPQRPWRAESRANRKAIWHPSGQGTSVGRRAAAPGRSARWPQRAGACGAGSDPDTSVLIAPRKVHDMHGMSGKIVQLVHVLYILYCVPESGRKSS